MQDYNKVTLWRSDDLTQTETDLLAQEVPVALVYNGISHVVMMATPNNLIAFAIGFSLAEGIVDSYHAIYDIELIEHEAGIEVHLEIASRNFMALKERRRTLNGRTGCGLCGVEQLKAIHRTLPLLPFTARLALSSLNVALQQLREQQPIAGLTGCTHAAACLDQKGQLLACCEDVGRHVALDKVLGLRAQAMLSSKCVLITSRASYEMVQKAISCGVEILIAASAATALAVDIAQTHRLTLIGFCRMNKATIYCWPHRLENYSNKGK